jgi:hypothetical protein
MQITHKNYEIVYYNIQEGGKFLEQEGDFQYRVSLHSDVT